jgi:hypothetical protein
MKLPLVVVAAVWAGCYLERPVGPPVGVASRPYTTLPAYLAHPISEHELTPKERGQYMTELLRDIDARAATLDGTPGQTDELKLKVHELSEVVPPTPSLLLPVERMKLVLDETSRVTPDDTRRRLWALTDLVRLRAHF